MCMLHAGQRMLVASCCGAASDSITAIDSSSGIGSMGDLVSICCTGPRRTLGLEGPEAKLMSGVAILIMQQ